MIDPCPPARVGWPTCPTPGTALPGAEWTCPHCGRRFVALDDDGPDCTFVWDEIGGPS